MTNRRTLLLLAACAAVVAAFLLTRGGSSGGNPARPAFRPVKGGEQGTPDTRSGYDNFKLIHTRNVFDPDRRAPRTGPAPTATPPPARSDYVALTGTFFDGEKKQLAFFSGTRPEYNKILTVRDQIAGATINKITGENVEVLRDGKPITVAVGQTVPFDGSTPVAAPAPAAADTAVGDNPGAPAAPAVAAAPNPGVPNVPAASGAPAANGAPGAVPASPKTLSSSKQDEIRRRMEERRRQEQK